MNHKDTKDTKEHGEQFRIRLPICNLVFFVLFVVRLFFPLRLSDFA
jgi:hypothetical protein